MCHARVLANIHTQLFSTICFEYSTHHFIDTIKTWYEHFFHTSQKNFPTIHFYVIYFFIVLKTFCASLVSTLIYSAEPVIFLPFFAGYKTCPTTVLITQRCNIIRLYHNTCISHEQIVMYFQKNALIRKY